ncbi:hypothetical protein KRX57_08295 [Weeksellaceae bacterium TAE3-ERU29]|nr:hypothetical protein [Weeksellaceae bacterium TAE3-ERU29]
MEIKILLKKNKRKLYILLLIILVMCIFGIFIILYPSKFIGVFIFRTKFSVIFSGYVVLLFSIFGLVQHIYHLYFSDTIFGLKISDEGIVNNSILLFNGLIKWEDIRTITISKKYNTINIIIKKPENHIRSTKNILRKINMIGYYVFYKTPCVISSDILDVNPENLEKLLKNKLRDHKKAITFLRNS